MFGMLGSEGGRAGNAGQGGLWRCRYSTVVEADNGWQGRLLQQTCLMYTKLVVQREGFGDQQLLLLMSCAGVSKELIDRIPGRQTDRKTPLGELNWIFTAITDTIAWNSLPRALFQKLFRQVGGAADTETGGCSVRCRQCITSWSWRRGLQQFGSTGTEHFMNFEVCSCLLGP